MDQRFLLLGLLGSIVVIGLQFLSGASRPPVNINVSPQRPTQGGPPAFALLLIILVGVAIIFVPIKAFFELQIEPPGRDPIRVAASGESGPAVVEASFTGLSRDLSTNEAEGSAIVAENEQPQLDPPDLDDTLSTSEKERLSQLLTTSSPPPGGLEGRELELEEDDDPETLPDGQSRERSTLHIVQSGENLYRISLAYGVSIEEIQAANPAIVDINQIRAGQELIIPSTEGSITQGRGGGDPVPSQPLRQNDQGLNLLGDTLNLELIAESSSMLELRWTDVTDEDGYRVYYRHNSNEEWVLAAALPADEVTAAFPYLSPDTTYQYYVQAFNADGNLNSSIVEAVTLTLEADSKKQGLIQPGQNRFLIAQTTSSDVSSFASYYYEIVEIFDLNQFSLVGCRERDTENGTKETIRWVDSGTWEITVIQDDAYRIEFRPNAGPPFAINYVNGIYYSPIENREVLRSDMYQC